VVKLNRQLEQRVADQVGEIERMGRLRRFLPRTLRLSQSPNGKKKKYNMALQQMSISNYP
jgi:hypothetical protein